MFYFQGCGNMAKENIMYQQLQKICKERVCGIKFFRANPGKFGQNILCTPEKLSSSIPIFLFNNISFLCWRLSMMKEKSARCRTIYLRKRSDASCWSFSTTTHNCRVCLVTWKSLLVPFLVINASKAVNADLEVAWIEWHPFTKVIRLWKSAKFNSVHMRRSRGTPWIVVCWRTVMWMVSNLYNAN